MKRIHLFVLSFTLLISIKSLGEPQPTKDEFDKLNQTVQSQGKSVEQQKNDIADIKNNIGVAKPGDSNVRDILSKITDRVTKVETKNKDWPRTLDDRGIGALLTLSPLILFLIFFLACFHKMDFKKWIKDSVTDPDKPLTQTTYSTTYTTIKHNINGVESTTEIPQSAEIKTNIDSYGKSASRMVMFFSSFLTIILALSFSTVFIYGYLRGGEVPSFSELMKVLLSLGIGIVPYAVNQFNKPDSNNPTPTSPTPVKPIGS